MTPANTLALPTGVASVPAASVPDRLSVALSLTAQSEYGVDSSRPPPGRSSPAGSSRASTSTSPRRSPPPTTTTTTTDTADHPAASGSREPLANLATPVPLPSNSRLLSSSSPLPAAPPTVASSHPALARIAESASSLASITPRAASRSAHSLAALSISSQVMTMHPYSFPTERLQRTQVDPQKEPLVLVACGSYSPITYLHLRMFEMAMDWVREDGRFEILAGYFSPVHEAYGKVGLASAAHRVAMCRLAAQASDWLMVDTWEPTRDGYVRTVEVLDHFNQELNGRLGGVELPDGTRRKVRIMLLAGGDLIESFGTPNLWAEADLHRILGEYGCFIIERTGADVWAFLLSHDILYEHRRNVFVVKQLIYNDISSTKVRLFVKRNMSIKYLVPDAVMHHIYAHRLYIGEREPPSAVI
ncbi:hypothetical protein BCR44DRAFT_60830 [Catenaria anguillulae PL171]|uniref:Nicotinamide-nucleotide adenylyltransferase n=1 Tax=Catenaria anguillulae PL171 TaxID=765915 RepID=A0A1Y2H7B3_9FUNG|nr:hypothetical protein BCR44DRAFT_60830 [Catenaria anguillulae PL171]